MSEFKKILKEELDQISTGPMASVLSAAHKVKEAESVLRNAKDELHASLEAINTKLAFEIRKRSPKLQVNLSDGKVQVYYKSKAVIVSPNALSGKWEIDPNDMGRSFVKGFAHALPMQDDLSSIAEAVVEYFGGHYKTLGDTYQRARSNSQVPKLTNEQRPIRKRGTSKPGNAYYA
jgi:hypothetical protein